MKDDFETTFVVELAPAEVWRSLTERTIEQDGTTHFVLAGFPSMQPLPVPGASCTPLETEPGRLLRVRKDHWPCEGTEILIELEQASTGTRVRVVQSGFGAFLDMVGPDTVFSHGQQIANDLRLYIERGITAPGTAWRTQLGAVARQTPTGLELVRVDGGFAQAVGLEPDDLLLTLRGIRIHDLQQLWTVLALTESGSEAEITWARGRDAMSATAAFA